MNRFRNNSQFWSQAAVLILVAIAYWVAVRLGLLFVAQPEGVAFIWPASGLALAILLLNPKRQWPILLAVIFVTNAAGNWSGGNPLLVSLGFALANILETLLGAWALTWLCKSKITFGRTVEIFALFGVAIFSNGLTALLGAAVPVLAFGAPFMNTWLVWWISDGLGILLVTPFIVTWATSQNMFQTAPPRRIVEAVLLVLVLVKFAWLLFGSFTVAEEPVLRDYMLFPLLIWLAFRYSPRGMANALTLLAAIAIWNTLRGYGIFGFAGQTVTQHLVSVQLLLSVTTFTGLLLSAIVAEQKRGEGALKQNEEKYRKLVDLTPDGLLIHVGGTIIYANNAAANILGLANPDDMAGKKLMDFIHPDYRGVVAEHIRQITENKNNVPLIEEKLVRPDGAVIDAEVTAISFNYAGENAVQVVFRDITERKQAEDALNKTQQLLKETQRMGKVGGWEFNIDTGKLIWTEEIFNIHEVDLAYEPTMEKGIQFYTRTSRPIFEQAMQQALKYGEPFDVELEIITAKGSFRWVHAIGKADLEHHRVFGFFQDITGRRQAEEVSRRAEASLAEAQRVSYLGSWDWDLTTGKIQFSDEMFHLVGMIHGDAEITRAVFAKFLHPDEAEQILQDFLQSTAAHSSGIEHQIVQPDGKIRNALSRIKAYCDENGKPLRLLGSTQDITERKQAEEEIRQLNVTLEQRVEERTRELKDTQEQLVRHEKLAVLGQLAGGVGHELRNPLAVIVNAVYFLKLVQPEADEKIKEYLGIIERETHNAEKIITDLLDFSRIRSTDREAVSVSELVQRVLARYPAPASVTASLDFPPDLPMVFADPRQMEQILGNLVVNACQAMPEGGELVISVQCSVISENTFVAISVRDSGAGISPENMKKLFEPLFTTKAKGIGLGLAVSQKLAEANGGRIEVQSEPGVGSTFTLWLPVQRGEQ